MGTPAFAVPSLRALADEHRIIAVYTRPDAVSGRGSRVRASEVKLTAEELGLPVVQPRTLRDPETVEALRSLAPDLIVVAAYGAILPDEVLDIAPLGTINVHGSLLPRWRGAAPIERAILAGDERVGVTIMQVVTELDAGDYANSVSVESADLNTEELRASLAQAGAAALLETIRDIESGDVEWTAQDLDLVTYADKIEKAEVALDPTLPVDDLHRRIRASSKHAPARLRVADHGVTALAAGGTFESSLAAGRFEAVREGVALGASDGTLVITRLKPDGKGEMAAADWLRGLRVTSGEWTAIS